MIINVIKVSHPCVNIQVHQKKLIRGFLNFDCEKYLNKET